MPPLAPCGLGFSTGRAASGFVWPVGSTGGGRNPYAPLPDRVMWTLPELGLSSFPDEALRCADWLISIRPFMNDLSPASAEWWSPVEREADDLYTRWQMASPLDRIRIVPEASRRCKLRCTKGLRRVRSRRLQKLSRSRCIKTWLPLGISQQLPCCFPCCACTSLEVWLRDNSCCKV